MIYLAAFALTYAAVWGISRSISAPAGRALVSGTAHGTVLHGRNIQRFCLYLAATLPVFLLSALRQGIGTDYYFTYTPRFLEIVQGERTYYEIGFYYVNRVIALFTHDPQWVFVVTSAVFCFCLFTAFYELAEDLPFCVLLLLASGEYFISLNNLRQAMASAILLLGVPLVLRRRWVAFGILTLLCATIHQGILPFIGVMVLFVVMEYIPLEKLLVIITVGVGAVLLLFNLSPSLLAQFLPGRLAYYVQYSIFNEPTVGFSRTVMNVGIFGFLLFTRQRSGDRRMDPLVLVQFIAVCVCLFDHLIPATYRILRLFTFWQLVSLPMAADCYSTRYHCRLWVKAGILLALGALCVYTIVLLGHEAVLPYQSIFG